MTKPTPSVRYELRGNVGLILVDRPPVNAIDLVMRSGLSAALDTALGDAAAEVVLLACAGRTFMAGADISEFGADAGGPPLRDLYTRLEASPKPVVAVLHGTALGGGLEAALACHYRAAVPTARMGLPELSLGLIPGAGGTQRLPRVIGARAALDMILKGRPVDAARAKELGLVDEIVEGDPVEAGLAYAQRLCAGGAGPRPTSEMPVDLRGFDDAGIDAALAAHAKLLRGRSTQHLLIKALKAAAEMPLETGLKVEQRLADQSERSAESAALRYLLFAERKVGKIPGLPAGGSVAAWSKVAVVGAGTMGSGIATAFANSGLEVALIDATAKGLERGLELIRSHYEAAVARGLMSEDQARERRGSIEGSLELSAAEGADLVVEAVFEDLDLKKSVLATLDRIVPAHAVIASNTSTLSVTELGRSTSRPEQVVGLHFFSPAHIMRLLEIVRGEDTTPETLLTALQVAKRLRKIGVVAGDGYGFIGNRMMLDGYFREAEQLLLEGATPEQVDRVMETFGFAMGPNKVNDMAGVDVGSRARQQLFLRESRPDPYFPVSDALTPMGRLGQKSGKGVYRYEGPGGRKPQSDPEVTALIERLAGERGIARREVTDAEIEERCLLALINVGARVLEEGIAYRASDVDVVWTSGYGFPRHRGGPMFYADTLGLDHVLERVRAYHETLGFYWKPAKLLEELAAKRATFAAWDEREGDESESKSVRRRSV